MKLVKVLPMLAVASFCLMGCASKCDYAKFHEKATAVKTASLVYIVQTAAAVGEDDNLEYYAGSTFKVVEKDSKATTEFNGFGLLTSYKSDSMKVSISYSKQLIN